MHNIDEESLKTLKKIMKTLRDPDHGCTWDRVQTFESIAPYAIEEAYEVVDAIERKNLTDLKDELGDLLLQVVFHSQMAEEVGAFTLQDVIVGICDKMTRRHPHIFVEGQEQAEVKQAEVKQADVKRAWEDIKAVERQNKNENGVLAGVPLGLPAMTRAVKLTKRASRVGFDWPTHHGPMAKVAEELQELKTELDAKEPIQDQVVAEFGDVLFSLANVARHLRIDPELALRTSNRKFVSRFSFVESMVDSSNQEWSQHSLTQLDSWWNQAKNKAHE